jgi:N-acetylmuramoyl-L-alanine amidase
MHKVNLLSYVLLYNSHVLLYNKNFIFESPNFFVYNVLMDTNTYGRRGGHHGGRRRFNKRFTVLIAALILGLGVFFVSRAIGLEDDDSAGGLDLRPNPVDTSLLETRHDHGNLIYTFSYSGGADLDFYRHRFIDPLNYIELIIYDPKTNTMILHTNMPSVFRAEYDENTGNVYIHVINPRENYSGRIVVIDPGHGGADVGAPMPGGVFESHLTLDISLKLYELLEASDSGIKAFMTRFDDSFVNPAGRTFFANEVGDILVSVHTNTYQDPIVAGTETLYNPLSAESAVLAGIIQRHLVEELGTRDRGIIQRRDLQLLNGALIPAVIAEIDFKTNPQALANLQNPDYRQRVAEALYRGIIEAIYE